MERANERHPDPIHAKWENLDGRRVRLWMLLPQNHPWPDPAAHPALLLLHGLGCSVEVWKPTLLQLADQNLERPVYAVDMPGFGRSEGPPDAMSVSELADWVVRFMDLLGLPSAHIIGNSLGCQVALAVARQHPGRAASLILGGAVTGGDGVSPWRMGLGLLCDGLMEPGVYDGSIARMYAQTGPRRYLKTVTKMWQDHPILEAGAVSVPCLIVRGTRDTAVSEQAVRTLAEVLPCGTFHAIEGSPHAVQYAAPEVFSDQVRTFVAQVEAQTTIAVVSRLIQVPEEHWLIQRPMSVSWRRSWLAQAPDICYSIPCTCSR